MNILGIIIYLGYAYFDCIRKNIKPFMVIFSIASIVLGVCMWGGIVSLLSIAGET